MFCLVTPFISVKNIHHVTTESASKKRNGGKKRGSGREMMESEVPRWQEVSAFWLSAREKYGKRDETGVKSEAGSGRKKTASDKRPFAMRQNS